MITSSIFKQRVSKKKEAVNILKYYPDVHKSKSWQGIFGLYTKNCASAFFFFSSFMASGHCCSNIFPSCQIFYKAKDNYYEEIPLYCVQVVFQQPLLPLVIINTHGTYHDPAAVGLWLDVPQKPPSSELFDLVGRPSSPPPHDSVTAAPPVTQSQERRHSDSDLKTAHFSGVPCATVPASGFVSLH